MFAGADEFKSWRGALITGLSGSAFLLFALMVSTVVWTGLAVGVAYADAPYSLGPSDAGAVGADKSTVSEPTSCAGWSRVPSPSPGVGPNFLRSVAIVSANDVWAVGSYGPPGSRLETLVEHWDGIQWSVVPSPNLGDSHNELYGVAAISANDVWAVGNYQTLVGEFSEYETLIMHWNGSVWSIAPSPSHQSRADDYLMGVTAIAANDVWAVGRWNGLTSMNNGMLILHWNGSAWSIVPSPGTGAIHDDLQGVVAVAANDIWAVGNSFYGSASNMPVRTLVLHWNGSAWSVVPSPNAASNSAYNWLNGVAAVSRDDIWAVGYSQGPNSGALALHWDGSIWSVAAINSPLTVLYGVAAVASNDVWAVGIGGNSVRALVKHWNGSAWSVAPTINVEERGNEFLGVAAKAGSGMWAVGSLRGRQVPQETLAHRYGPLQFGDMPATNPFYPYVMCLACRNIVGSYPDGAFRPNTKITRGQIAGFVSDAAGFSESARDPMIYADVLQEAPFYDQITRLSRRGVMGGYPCGGPGEPCNRDNWPYFRPNAEATRGQMAKIVSNAAGYNDPPTGQTFEDVPPTHPFYEWVQRLASRGIMGGYPCGAVRAEPCVDPENRPYFRPANSVTRGQSAKIVANTFFPNCEISAK